jgi:hypothetical protein
VSTENIDTGFSAWERQVFAAMTGASTGENLTLPEFRNILAQGTEPLDVAFADIVHDYMVFRFGEAGGKPVEIPSNIGAARLGSFEGSQHEILEQVHHLQSTYYWGATESLLRETLSLCATIEASSDLREEREFLGFLNEDILDGIAEQFSNNIREEVENGFITGFKESHIENLEAAIERLGKLSTV